MFVRLFSIAQANTDCFFKALVAEKNQSTSASEQPAKSKVAPLQNHEKKLRWYTLALQYTIISTKKVGEMSRRFIVQTSPSANLEVETVKVCTPGGISMYPHLILTLSSTRICDLHFIF